MTQHQVDEELLVVVSEQLSMQRRVVIAARRSRDLFPERVDSMRLHVENIGGVIVVQRIDDLLQGGHAHAQLGWLDVRSQRAVQLPGGAFGLGPGILDGGLLVAASVFDRTRLTAFFKKKFTFEELGMWQLPDAFKRFRRRLLDIIGHNKRSRR